MQNNIETLRTKLWDVIGRIETDPSFVAQAVQINNAAGKLISTAKVQLEYHALRKEIPIIEFLTTPKN
jgi:hypothetical protein